MFSSRPSLPQPPSVVVWAGDNTGDTVAAPANIAGKEIQEDDERQDGGEALSALCCYRSPCGPLNLTFLTVSVSL